MNELNKIKNSGYELDSEFKVKASAALSNVITNHMMDNELTIEILDLAYELVKDVFRTDAIIRNHRPLN